MIKLFIKQECLASYYELCCTTGLSMCYIPLKSDIITSLMDYVKP